MKYLDKQLVTHKGKAVWLVSYPKSGNTWFRCFLSALFTGEVNLSKLSTDGIFSSRGIFDNNFGINSRLLTENEVNNALPHIFTHFIGSAEKLLFIKVHDAYQKNELNKDIFPKKVTHKVIYLVRNPLDIVASFANHNNSTIDKTIQLMNSSEGTLGRSRNIKLNTNNQFGQFMGSWSDHYMSWTSQKKLDVKVIKYEDMLANSFYTFKESVKHMGIECSDSRIKKAIKLSSFSKLSKSEQKHGFKEKNAKSEVFFRSGKKGGFVDELSKIQINNILQKHSKVMKKLKYI